MPPISRIEMSDFHSAQDNMGTSRRLQCIFLRKEIRRSQSEALSLLNDAIKFISESDGKRLSLQQRSDIRNEKGQVYLEPSLFLASLQGRQARVQQNMDDFVVQLVSILIQRSELSARDLGHLLSRITITLEDVAHELSIFEHSVSKVNRLDLNTEKLPSATSRQVSAIDPKTKAFCDAMEDMRFRVQTLSAILYANQHDAATNNRDLSNDERVAKLSQVAVKTRREIEAMWAVLDKHLNELSPKSKVVGDSNEPVESPTDIESVQQFPDSSCTRQVDELDAQYTAVFAGISDPREDSENVASPTAATMGSMSFRGVFGELKNVLEKRTLPPEKICSKCMDSPPTKCAAEEKIMFAPVVFLPSLDATELHSELLNCLIQKKSNQDSEIVEEGFSVT